MRRCGACCSLGRGGDSAPVRTCATGPGRPPSPSANRCATSITRSSWRSGRSRNPSSPPSTAWPRARGAAWRWPRTCGLPLTAPASLRSSRESGLCRTRAAHTSSPGWWGWGRHLNSLTRLSRSTRRRPCGWVWSIASCRMTTSSRRRGRWRHSWRRVPREATGLPNAPSTTGCMPRLTRHWRTRHISRRWPVVPPTIVREWRHFWGSGRRTSGGYDAGMTAQLRDAVIVDAVRTPVGRYNGVLREVRPDELAAHGIKERIRPTGIDPNQVEDVIFGASNQAGEDNRNVARMALLLAGLPVAVAGQTVNRRCGSGMQAVASAAQAIKVGEGDVLIAGGVESMTRAPFVMAKPQAAFPRGEVKLHDTTLGWRFTNPKLAESYPPFSMGETAENVAERFRRAREVQDRFALLSHQRAVRAIAEGRFKDEIVPVVIPQPSGAPVVVDTDEHPRADTTLEKLAALRPVFKKDGSVTAGNSSGINDGAAAVLLVSAEAAERLNLTPMARVIASAVAGVDPAYMGLGPIPATRKVLERTGLTIDDMAVVELNEAFAAQVLPCIRELKIPPDKLNPNGGAIAMGHPIGFSGARLVTTLVHELRRRKGRFGLATMCIGVGQGIALVVENLA